MDEITAQFIQVFDSLLGIDQTIIEQVTVIGTNLLANPSSANSLILILQQDQNPNHRQQAAIFLRRFVMMHQNEIGDQTPIISQLLNIILQMNDTNEEIQRKIINVIGKFNMILAKNQIIEFVNQALAAQPNVRLLNASILLCRKLELDQCQDDLNFFKNLIQQGLTCLSPTYPLDFAFKLGDICDDENDTFFIDIWNSSVQTVIQNLNDVNMVKYITGLLCSYLNAEPHIAVFANPIPVLTAFLPIVGRSDVDVDVQLCMCSAISTALDVENVLDDQFSSGTFHPDTFFGKLLDKFITVTAINFSPEDPLALSNVDILNEICLAFSGDSSFIDSLFSRVQTFYAQPQTRPGIVYAIGYALGELSDDVADHLDDIAPLLIQSLVDPIKLVRDCAAFAVGEFANSYPEKMDDYSEQMVLALLDSLNKEKSQDMFIALSNVLSNTANTDPIFEATFSFLMQSMNQAHANALMLLFPCFTELCSNSLNSIKNVFENVIGMLFQILQNNEFLIEQAVKCISNLSCTVPELFTPHVARFAELQCQFLQSGDQSYQTTSLLSFGKLLENHSALLEPILEKLVPIFLEISQKDLRGAFTEEVAHYLQKMQQLEQNGEVEFETSNEGLNEDDECRMSPFAIPALAVSVLCSILMHFPQLIPSLYMSVLQSIQIQINNPNSDAITYTCNSISLLMRAFAKAQIPNRDEVSSALCTMSLDILNAQDDSCVAVASIEAIAQIIEIFGANSIGEQNFQKLLVVIGDILEGRLKCMNNNKDYIKDIHEAFCGLVNELIASLGQNAPSLLENFIPKFVSLATHKKANFRDIALQILGQLVEHSSTQIPPDLKMNILQFVIAGIRKDSQHAAFALNQFTNGDGPLLLPKINDIIGLVHSKLLQREKKGVAYVGFIDNLVAAVGEIRRNVLKDQFPLNEFLELCLSKMPARHDTSTNLDMMTFFVWMAQVTQCTPADRFAAAAIRLFMQPIEDIGGIAEDSSSNVLQNVANIMSRCLSTLQNGEAMIHEICENDPFKIQRVQNVLNSFNK